MTPIELHNVTFAYPLEEQAVASDSADGHDSSIDREPVFTGLDLELPGGFTFLVGPNGIGKSTLMLLAAARLFPQQGTITIGGRDTREFINGGFEPELELERNELVSFVYQNMEFETEEPIGDVLKVVARNGSDPANGIAAMQAIVEVAGLENRLSVRMHELSKGEMQRAIVAMSVLYGSPVVMLDEPVFAVEPERTERLFRWLRRRCENGKMDIYASVHDVRLAQTFADAVILMHADGTVEAGVPDQLLSRERLEEAFRAPFDTLYQRQNLYRELLLSGTVGGGDS